MATYVVNRKAFFDFQVLETIEAGLALVGHEVKAIKNSKVSIKGAYVRIIGGEAWLVGATISPYQPQNISADYDPQRSRKVLLKKSEIKYLIGKTKEKGLTLVPIKLYNKKGFVKLEIAIARGKRKADKRETIIERETKRRLQKITARTNNFHGSARH